MTKLSKTEQFAWVLGFVGTGIGAGILFLPMQAGIGGIICFLISSSIAFTFSYISHKVFTRLVIDSSSPKDYIQIVKQYLGNSFSFISAIMFFLLMIGYLTVYVLGLNIGVSEYLYSLNIIPVNCHKTYWFPFIVVFTLAFIITLNEKIIIKLMSLITFPLIALLLFLSVYLMRYWNLSYIFAVPDSITFSAGMFFNIPILIFAALFFPPITSMVLSFKKTFKEKKLVEEYSFKCLKYAQIILLGFTVFFTLSCLLATPPDVLKTSLHSNLNIMAILGKVYKTKGLSIVGPLIAVIAIITSFLGYYFGAKESAKNLIEFYLIKYKHYGEKQISSVIDSKKVLFSINITLGIYLWIVAVINFNIERFVGIICTPVTALLLYIIPFIIFLKIPLYKNYRGFVFYSTIIGAVFLLLSVYTGDLITYFF